VRDHRRDAAGLLYVYPVMSRRAGGVSIGINLNPNRACNWRCAYCQVPDLVRGAAPPVDLPRLETELRGFVADVRGGRFLEAAGGQPVSRIADFALSGDGEPTSADRFAEVIELVGRVRAEFALAPEAAVRVITNGSLVERAAVRQGLQSLARLGGEAWFKLDAGRSEDYERINGVTITPEQVVRRLRACASACPTWVQTCVFLMDGHTPGQAWEDAYLSILGRLEPGIVEGILLYGLARPSLQPEAPRLAALPEAQIAAIGERLRQATGLTVRVSP
jgi:wyosine [tRNA(Phe)-imidazoG37] synthetase (radical SAM superfamily)